MADTSRFDKPSIPQYFNYTYDAPDAIIILNRGTSFEQDITNDVITATTSHSVDSIAGSFNVTIDNTNERYVDRFNNTFVKKMSAIEIFIKSLGESSDLPSAQVKAEGTISIPQDAKNLNDIVKLYFPKASEEQKNRIRNDIISLNQGLIDAVTAYKIDKVIIAQQFATVISQIKVGPGFIDLIYVDTKKATSRVITTSIPTNNLSQTVFTIAPGSEEQLKPVVQFITSSTISQTLDPKINNNDFLLSDTDSGRIDQLRKFAIKIPPSPTLYQRIFLGVVLNVTQNITPGSPLAITISGKTSGYWMESSVVNIFPGGFETTFNDLDLSATANRYAQSHAMDIFRDLIRFSTDDILKVVDFNLGNIGTTQQSLELIGTTSTTLVDAYGAPLKTADGSNTLSEQYSSTTPTQHLKELDNNQNNLYSAKPFVVQNPPSADWKRLAAQYDSDNAKLTAAKAKFSSIDSKYDPLLAVASSDAQRERIQRQQASDKESSRRAVEQAQAAVDADKTRIEKLPEFKNNTAAIDQNIANTNKDIAKLMQAGRNKLLDQFNIVNHWKQIFSQNVLEVVDQNNFLNLVYPFKWDIRAPEASMDGDYVAKADIARMIAENLMYEFYMDTNGHFVLKPPLYNIGIDANDPTYIVRDNDLVSLSINDSAEGIITRIGVTGDYAEAANVTLEKVQIYNIHQDLTLIRDYGFHGQEISNRMFLHSFADCRDFGKAYMTKNNMELFSASLTIIGRPEVRLGTSIYIEPKDTVFYIKEISHEITAGGEFKTTLNLIGGRRIITGFKTKTSVQNFVNQYQKDTKQYQVVKATTTAQDIENYILSGSTNQQSISQFGQDNSVDAIGIGRTAFGNFNDNSTASDLKVPVILKNVFQITTHVNPALIGLIVDRGSDALSDINKANYDFIHDLNTTNTPLSATDLNIKSVDLQPGIEIIKSAFVKFANLNGVTPETFTIDLKESFIIKFLSQTKNLLDNEVIGDLLDFLSPGDAKNQVIRRRIAASCVIFNVVISGLDNNGDYRQYTDSDGRELPAYLDYGKTLIIENTQLSVNQFNIIQATEEQKQQEARKKARLVQGTNSESAGSDAIKDAITKRFKELQPLAFINNSTVKPGDPNQGTFQSTTPTAQPTVPTKLIP